MSYIYLITNNINGKRYVGKTTETIEKRWKRHLYDAYKRKSDFYFHRAIRKYGSKNFSVEEVIQCSKKELNEKEKYYIKYYQTYYSYGKGYNLTRGGDGGTQVDDDEVLQAWNEGYSTSEIAKQFSLHMATVLKSLKRNEIPSEEISHRSRMHASLRTCKKVYQYDLNGKIVSIYDNLNDMNEKTGYRKDYIGGVCNHQYTNAYGYLWVYEDDEIPIENLLRVIPDELNHPVSQYTLDGKFIKDYISHGEAERENGLSHGSLSKVSKSLSTTAGGYIWIDKKSDITIEQKLNAIANRYNDRKKPIFQYDSNGKFIKEYKSIIEAAIQNNIDRSNIQKSSASEGYLAGGYIWLRYRDDTKAKQLAKKHDDLTIPVEQYDTKGNYIATYSSARAAAKALGQENKFHNIYAAIRGRQKTSLGYKWKYKEST